MHAVTGLRAARPKLRAREALPTALAALLARWEGLSLALLVVGAGWPEEPNSVQGILHPHSYLSVWSFRVGPANGFELAFAGLGVLWLIRRISLPGKESAFDRPLLVGCAVLATLQLLALALNVSDVKFLPFDVERVLVPVAAYAIVTRCIRDLPRLRVFLLIVAGALAARAAELVIVGGILSDTQFGTLTGRHALLITEDSLLVALPLMLAWGALVDGRLSIRGKLLTIFLAAAVFAVNLLSLRRGALLFIGAGLMIRSVTAPRIVFRRLAPAAVAVLVALLVVGPRWQVAHDIDYVLRSAVLQSKDAGSSQRTAELRNFGDNVHGIDWIVGKGLGTIWRARFQAPIDLASFGSGETAYMRIGWHVYGLDWAYKFGVLGLLMILATAVALGRKLVGVMRFATGWPRSYGLSLAVCLLVFVPFVFTGIRIGMVAGLVLGALSKLADLSGRASEAAPSAVSRPGF